MSWIYHRFPAWGAAHLDVPMFPLARRVPGSFRLGGCLYGDTNLISVMLRIFDGCHMEEMSSSSSHLSGYKLVRRFGLGSRLFRLFVSTWFTCTTWTG
ncbi:hypothetical protein PIB30_069097 [Stylosanthes scabra]|uniref:Uncharacterized protein n=1 Tax=Stylosanthes scabra TaxID=79078 RepID=A0ABU6RNP2_9FABA|nr:hypothetical protein [Stylosanthes scabra]